MERNDGRWTMARNLPALTPLFRTRHRRAYQVSVLGAVYFWGGLVIGFISLGAYRDNLWLAIKGEKLSGEVVSVKPTWKFKQVAFRVSGESGTHEDWVSGTRNVRVGDTVAVWRLEDRPQVCRLSNSPISVHLALMLFSGIAVCRGYRKEILETE